MRQYVESRQTEVEALNAELTGRVESAPFAAGGWFLTLLAISDRSPIPCRPVPRAGPSLSR
jgi:hypothetical protein